MTSADFSHDAMKQAIKEALAETLHEQRDLPRDVLCEVVEDVGLVAAMEEGQHSEYVDRERISQILRGSS